DEHAFAESLADIARARRIVLNGVDADLYLVSGDACRFLLFSVAQVAIAVAAADHAQQGHAASLLPAKQRMHRHRSWPARNKVESNFNCGFGVVIATHAAVHD